MAASKTLFSAIDSGGYDNLWVFDQNTGASYEIATVNGSNTTGSIPYGISPQDLTPFNGNLIFSGVGTNGNRDLWVTNGTTAGTFQLTHTTWNLNPNNIFVFHNQIYFVAADRNGNYGLWISDGTPLNTYELDPLQLYGLTYEHLVLGPVQNLHPHDIVYLNGSIYFFGSDNSNQLTPDITPHPFTGLWRTDGTIAGTVEIFNGDTLVEQFYYLGLYFNMWGMKVINNRLVFLADSGDLLSSDGTVAGTQRLANGVGGDVTAFNGKALFSSWDALWITDGTWAGTSIVAKPYWGNLDPSNITVLNGKAIFNGVDETGNRGAWVTDGTSGGTYELTNIAGADSVRGGLNPSNFFVANGEAFFTGLDSNGSLGLWRTDGTSVGTHEIGAAPTNPTDMTILVSNPEHYVPPALFNGENAAGARGLWRTDGTAWGTQEIAGISGASSNGVNPGQMTAYGNKIVFSGQDAAGRYELWITDGTAQGTSELTNITGESSRGITPTSMTQFNGKIYFAGLDSSSHYGLWSTNGTVSGTIELANISGEGSLGISPRYLTAFSGMLLFAGYDSASAYCLYASDGTAAGTHQVLPPSGGSLNGLALNPQYLTVFGNRVLFAGQDSSGHTGLWSTDGTAQGTTELANISGEGSNGITPQYLTVFNGKVFFSGQDSSGHTGLWATDGSVAGTYELANISGEGSGGLNPQYLTAFNGQLLFSGFDSANDYCLYTSNGTAQGTVQLLPVNGAAYLDGLGLEPAALVVEGDEVLFQGKDWNGARCLWATDGTSAGTHKIADVATAYSGGLDPIDLTTLPRLAPWIGGTLAAQRIADTQVAEPFQSVAIFDATSATTETVKITLSAANNGAFSNLGGGTYNVATGVYSVSGSASAVTAAIDNLVFAPTPVQAPPGGSVTTTFTISVTDNLGLTASDSTTSVITAFGPASLASFQANRAALDNLPGGFAVADIAQRIHDNLASLEADANHVASITATDGQQLRVTVAQFLANQPVLDKIAGGFVVADTAMAIHDNQTALQADTGHIASIDEVSQANILTIVPMLAITSAGVTTNNTIQTITGTIDAADAGLTVSIYDGATLRWTVTPAADGTWSKTVTLLNNGANVLTARATDAAGNVGISNAVTDWVAQNSSYTGNDFISGGVSDVLFLNASAGNLGFYQLNNDGTLQGWHNIANYAPSYSVVGTGDFNGDGISDILFRNASTGDTGYYQINSNGALQGWHDINNSSTAYSVVGVGDFDGDGRAEILFRDNAGHGDVGFYELNRDGTFQGWHDINNSSIAYNVVGTGDFDGDGRSDILFHNATTGDTGYYKLNADGSFNSWHDIGSSPAAYSVVGVGDFSGDGVSDVLFRNNTNGDTGYYQLNSDGSFQGWRAVGSSSPAYSVVGTGDFNSSGMSEILFRNNSTGDTGFYQLNANGSFNSWHDIGGSATSYGVF